ncbi:MAG TPA: hypothetical protein VMO47_14810 [Rhodothermales bacterium]|nr:hypothetical protein [Rhodothermales bacterium]
MSMPASILRTYTLATAVLLGAGVSEAPGQVIPGTPYSGSVESYYQSWDIDEGATSTTVTQVFAPISVFLPIADRLEARVSSAYVSMSRDTDFSDSESVSGLADLKLQVNGSFLQRRLILGLVANLPSGQGELTGLEQDIVYDFVSPDLSVRTNRLGEGFNIGGTVSFANALSESVTLGIGASVLSRGSYDTSLPGTSRPISLSPGLESRAGATLDILSGVSAFRLSSTLAMYGTEQVNDVDNYQIGQEITFAADYTVAYQAGRGRLSVGVLEMLRFDNSIRSNGSFDTEEVSSNGNYLVLHASNDYGVSPKLVLTVSALGRLVGANEFDAGDATVIESGLAATLTPTSNVAITLGGRLVKGSGTGFSGRDREIRGMEGILRTVVRLDR